MDICYYVDLDFVFFSTYIVFVFLIPFLSFPLSFLRAFVLSCCRAAALPSCLSAFLPFNLSTFLPFYLPTFPAFPAFLAFHAFLLYLSLLSKIAVTSLRLRFWLAQVRLSRPFCKAFSVSLTSGTITLASPLKRPIAAVLDDDLKKIWDGIVVD